MLSGLFAILRVDMSFSILYTYKVVRGIELDFQESDNYSEDYEFLNQMIEFLIDQLHIDIEQGNLANAEAIASKIRETQECL